MRGPQRHANNGSVRTYDLDMRHNNQKRSRGRGGRRPNTQSTNRSFDSNGPSGKLRGTPAQLSEKYQAMARDARVGRDRVLVENYFQHAEHYQRLANEILEAQTQAGEAAQNSGRHPHGAADGAAADQQIPVKPSAADSAEPKESEAAKMNGSGQDSEDVREQKKPRAKRQHAAQPPQPEVEAEAVEVSSDQGETPPAEAETAG